jgi:PAS domain S-box-containing protein
MQGLAALLETNEKWLMRRIRGYAVEYGYSRCTSSLEDACKISIGGLTEAVTSALAVSASSREPNSGAEFAAGPVAAFGVQEAQRHRARGLPLDMFMGLLKYYRQGYQDLLQLHFSCADPANQRTQEFAPREAAENYAQLLTRIFDRIETAFCSEWSRGETVNSTIDELQNANRQITSEKNMFLTIFESLPLAVFLLDDANCVMQMNLAAAQMLDPTATAGRYSLAQPAKRISFPWLAAELARFRDQGEGQESQALIELGSGEACQVLARFRPMQDISGKYPGTVVILQDITERQRAQENLQQARNRLIQQEKMAALGQLAAGVAHEINNPLGFITSNLSCLQKYVERLVEFLAVEDRILTRHNDPDPDLAQVNDLRKELKIDFISEDARPLIAESLEGAERIRRLVQNLKHFTQVDPTDYRPVDLNNCLQNAICLAMNELDAVATFKGEFGEIPHIWGYPQQLNQVFLNLLLNATQALGEHGEISVRSWSDADQVCISVADNGRGIPAALQARVFEPFFTTREIGQGTGLGLSICYGIIKNHGGKIELHSEEGRGSVFTLSLPLTAAG